MAAFIFFKIIVFISTHNLQSIFFKFKNKFYFLNLILLLVSKQHNN